MKENGPLDTAPTSGRRAAAWLAIGLIGGMLVLVVLTGTDRQRVEALEHFEETTAVGDTEYFQIPAPPSAEPTAAATLNGQALFPASYEKVEIRDTKVVRVGRDEAARLTIYKSREALQPDKGAREKEAEPLYLLKTGPGEYIKVRRSPAVK